MIYIVAINSPDHAYYMFQVSKDGDYRVILPGSVIRITTVDSLYLDVPVAIRDVFIQEGVSMVNTKGNAVPIESLTRGRVLESYYNKLDLI